MIRIVEGGRTAIESSIVELPLRRSELPNESVEVVSVFFVTLASTLCSKIELIPPFELCFWRQWHLAGLLAADQITAHGHHSLASLRPKRRDDICRPRSPIKTGDGCLLNLESVHEG